MYVMNVDTSLYISHYCVRCNGYLNIFLQIMDIQDDQFTVAPQSHLDTDPESTSTTLRGDDSFAVVGLGAHSI